MRLRPLHRISLALAIAALALTDGAAGQTRDKTEPQGFIRFPGITGTSPVRASKTGDKEWLELIHVSHVVPARAATGPGKVVLRKLLDKSSPLLARAFKQGTRFQTVRLDVPDTGDRPLVYLKYTLQNVKISEYRVDGQVEHITLTYEKIDRPRPPAPVAAPAR